jgi:long-chain acyl-CoA synthetase
MRPLSRRWKRYATQNQEPVSNAQRFTLPNLCVNQYILIGTISAAGCEPPRRWNGFHIAMSLATLNDIFFTVVERKLERAMLHRQGGEWRPVSSQEFGRSTVRTARALQEWGIRKGDRVAILSENRPEWPVADMATLLLGAVTVPLYTTLTAEQTAFLLNDAGCRVIFVSSETHLRKMLSIVSETKVEKIVVMDRVELAGGASGSTASVVRMDALVRPGQSDQDSESETKFEAEFDAKLEALARAIGPDDLATIVYTSGTTGASKGAMLTHGNIASNISCSLLGFDVQPGQISISFLPLCHITARHVDFSMLYHGVTLAYVPFMEQLPAALLEVRPTTFVAVPRVYEKIYAQAERKAGRFARRAMFDWALSVGVENKPEILAGRTPTSRAWKLANKLVFSKIREGMGGHVRTFISGGAPLGRELAEWYAAAGIRIHEGYGLTETSPVIAVNSPINHRIGTVGKILPNLEVRIAEDGEILVRGPSVFKGYWNRPQETQNAFVNGLISDGWFKTGDIGNIDADGYLSVTDRKKDLIKTSGGKFIAPQPIENSLKLNALIGTGAIVGDKRKFAAVIISPNFAALEDWARTNGVVFSSRGELVADPKVQALYEQVVEGTNRNLARFEKLKRVLLVADEFTVENGALTPTMKLRRRVIEDRYHRQIDELYAKAEAAVAP